MSTEVIAYNFHLIEMRFHRIQFDIPSYDDIDDKDGDLSIETRLRFGVDSDYLYCTLSAAITVTPEDHKSLPPEERTEIGIEVAGTGRFKLPSEHDITDEQLNHLSAEEVSSFSNVLDPLVVARIKAILIDAGINATSIPLQLKPIAAQDQAGS